MPAPPRRALAPLRAEQGTTRGHLHRAPTVNPYSREMEGAHVGRGGRSRQAARRSLPLCATRAPPPPLQRGKQGMEPRNHVQMGPPPLSRNGRGGALPRPTCNDVGRERHPSASRWLCGVGSAFGSKSAPAPHECTLCASGGKVPARRWSQESVSKETGSPYRCPAVSPWVVEVGRDASAPTRSHPKASG